MATQWTSPDFDGRRVTVLGLGAFGGGLGAVRFLLDRGAYVCVSDRRGAADLTDALQQLGPHPRLDLRLGGHEWSHFADTDCVVVNPAVKPDDPLLTRIASSGLPITSEMNLFWQFNRGRVVAVTGSNGKSTTTALIHALISASGQTCWLGGNIGHSLLPDVGRITADDWTVLELSSFQLHQLDALQARPHIAVVTNFSANHLDWHPDLDHYRRSKQTLLRWQTESDWCVLNGDDPDVSAWPSRSRRILFRELREAGSESASACLDERSDDAVVTGLAQSLRVRLCGNLKLPGRHNLQNTLAAIAAAGAAGVDAAAIEAGLRSFEPLPHRLQTIVSSGRLRFVNDSIATTPESAICGLRSFAEPIVLLAGGYDKQVDLSDFAREIAERCVAVALMGQTAAGLSQAITQHSAAQCQNGLTAPRQCVCQSFDEAFDWAVAQARAIPGPSVVLLSPGCASYDWFRNFVDRGDQFSQRARGDQR